jgi:uncharacterized protein (TIGR02145 family)
VVAEDVVCPYDSDLVYDDVACVEPIPLSTVVADNNLTNIQDLTAALCQSAAYDSTNDGVNANNTATLTDPRNNQAYQVRKLADGNCWMINNLRIALAKIDTANHNLSNPNVNFADLAAQTTSDNTGTITYSEPRYYGPLPAPTDPTYRCYGNAEGYDASNIADECFGGYLYNWCAAMGADAGSCVPNDGTYPTDLAGNAANSGNYDPLNTASICPANWRLPTGGPAGEFQTLSNAMTTANGNSDYQNFQFAGAFRGVVAGFWYSNFFSNGLYTYLWSSSANPSGASGAFSLGFDSGSVSPSISGSRGYGFPVRCLVGS